MSTVSDSVCGGLTLRVFVLCTGRCGSMTFAKACSHITNYTTAHESGGYADWSYPDDHIEVDNRLSWFLGSLHDHYPEDVRYLHLARKREDVANSFFQRFVDSPILTTYMHGVFQQPARDRIRPYVTNGGKYARFIIEHYLETVEANIRRFLWTTERKHLSITIPGGNPFYIENAADEFGWFWNEIGAEGDYDAAVAEFGKRYNKGT